MSNAPITGSLSCQLTINLRWIVLTKTMIFEYTEAKLAMCSFTDASTSWTIGVPADDRALSVLDYISLEHNRYEI
jgi:hypothetical protein